jgi:periplasmic protein CpxP/Spy
MKYKEIDMTTKRILLGVGASLVALGLSAGLYASARNTSQGPPPFSGRGMGPGGRGPGGPMGMLPMLGRELGITDAQKEQIKNIAQSHRDEWKALADRARAAHGALNESVTSGTVDEALIRQRSAAVAAVEADMAVARARTHAEVFQLLTPDQQAKARELRTQMQERMKQRGGPRGRGLF